MTRIMVVDDDPLIRQLLTYQLSGAGYSVCTAQDGRDALKRLFLDHPDLVLLDIVMPDMSGWDVCNQIRACSTIPVIMLTAKSGDNDVVTGLGVGADDYISKPFSLSQLLARVESVLRRASYAEPSVPRYRAGAPTTSVSSIANTSTAVLQPASAPPLPQHKQVSVPYPAPRMPHIATSAAYTEPSYLSLGETFARARKSRGISLHQAESGCGIQWEFLQAIEREQYGYIPRSQLRQVLKIYSEFLEIDLHTLLGKRKETPVQYPLWPVFLILIVTVTLVLVLLASTQLL